jgi:hypothetical protein
VRGDAETAEPMHDRPRIAGLLRHRGLGVQRIKIAAQPIDQGGFRARAEIANGVGPAFGERMRLCGLSRWSAKTSVAAAEHRVRYRCHRLAGRLVGDYALGKHQRTFALAFVDHFDDALAADHGALPGERTMQRDALLAVDDLHPVDPGVLTARPEAGMAKHSCHGRQHFQVLLINEGQLLFVHRIVTEADTERIEDAILGPVGLLLRRQVERHQFFIDDGHCFRSRILSLSSSAKADDPVIAAQRLMSRV